MATYRVLYWRAIPAMVEARDGPDSVAVQLSERFQTLIDLAAMELGLTEGDAYLTHWRQGREEYRPGSAQEVAESVSQVLEEQYDDFKSRRQSPE